METIYLVYGYYTDIQMHVMLRACSTLKRAEEYKTFLEKNPTKGLFSVHIEEEMIY